MFQVSAFGDRGLRIQLGDTITPKVNQQLRNLSLLLDKEEIHGVNEWIPTYTAITIYYNPYLTSYQTLETRVLQLKSKLAQIEATPPKLIHIPVCYGGKQGPDLLKVANYTGLDEEEVISIHSNQDYLIYMIGFTPGFPYLGGMSKRIATPRLSEPRVRIPVGTVGIAEEQTGIYSVETPGGWQLVGRTPLNLYDPAHETPILLEAGNYIRFTPISEKDYQEIEREVNNGAYKPSIEQLQ